MIKSRTIQLETKGEVQILDITDKVSEAIRAVNLENGIVNIFVIGSTAAVTTIEHEPGLLKDFPAMLERVAPKNISYEHEKTWHDGNGHSHVRASLVGPSLTVPFEDGKLVLGTWQQIVFVELDIRPRSRTLFLQFIGE